LGFNQVDPTAIIGLSVGDGKSLHLGFASFPIRYGDDGPGLIPVEYDTLSYVIIIPGGEFIVLAAHQGDGPSLKIDVSIVGQFVGCRATTNTHSLFICRGADCLIDIVIPEWHVERPVFVAPNVDPIIAVRIPCLILGYALDGTQRSF